MARTLPPANPYSGSRILIIDDEASNLRLLERLLGEVGLSQVQSTTDPRDAHNLFVQFQPDLVLLDLIMPHMDGFAILNDIRELIQPEDYLPILVLTANVTARAKQKALISGASDFLTKPFDLTEVTLRIFNLLRIRNLHLEVRKQKSALEETVAERTVALRKALNELAATQRQTVQQQRLQALGLMASGVAHDFNNSLNLVLGFTEYVLQELQSSGDRPELVGPLEIAMTAALDGAKIVSRLFEFHRPVAAETSESVDVNLLVEQAVRVTQPKWRKRAIAGSRPISIKTQLGELAQTSGDSAELREVLTNLIFNAVDAMPGGGTITLQTSATKEGILLQVSDTGMGMTEETRERCFEPFFTTKGEAGTGLGLAVVYGIIERHHGKLEVESEAGKGTTFKILLPHHEGLFRSGKAAQPPRALKVLIINARPMLGNLLSQYLEQDMHTVTRAGSGPEALEKVAQEKFDLVIADQDMPVMNGEEFVAALKQVAPKVRTVIFNRLASEEGGEQGDAPKEALDKPITITELRQVIRRAMR